MVWEMDKIKEDREVFVRCFHVAPSMPQPREKMCWAGTMPPAVSLAGAGCCMCAKQCMYTKMYIRKRCVMSQNPWPYSWVHITLVRVYLKQITR